MQIRKYRVGRLTDDNGGIYKHFSHRLIALQLYKYPSKLKLFYFNINQKFEI